MINLVMVVCAMQAPSHCKNVTLSFSEPGLTANACVRRGQSEIAKWSGEHPGWRVSRFMCGKVGTYAKV